MGGAPKTMLFSMAWHTHTHTRLVQSLVLPLTAVWSGTSYLISAIFSFLIRKIFPSQAFYGEVEIMHAKAYPSIWHMIGLAIRALSPFSFTLVLCRGEEIWVHLVLFQIRPHDACPFNTSSWGPYFSKQSSMTATAQGWGLLLLPLNTCQRPSLGSDCARLCMVCRGSLQTPPSPFR